MGTVDFYGTTDPAEAEIWLKRREKVFEMMRYNRVYSRCRICQRIKAEPQRGLFRHWKNHAIEEATWETEEKMNRDYPQLFDDTGK